MTWEATDAPDAIAIVTSAANGSGCPEAVTRGATRPAAVGAAAFLTHALIDVFTGGFPDVFTDVFPDVVTGAFAGAFTDVFTGVFTNLFTGTYSVLYSLTFLSM